MRNEPNHVQEKQWLRGAMDEIPTPTGVANRNAEAVLAYARGAGTLATGSTSGIVAGWSVGRRAARTL